MLGGASDVPAVSGRGVLRLRRKGNAASSMVAISMAWAKPQNTRATVDKAGEVFAASATDALLSGEWEAAVDVINNWRSSHSYPLQALKMTLLGRAKRI